jgi:hypothetical protein
LREYQELSLDSKEEASLLFYRTLTNNSQFGAYFN